MYFRNNFSLGLPSLAKHTASIIASSITWLNSIFLNNHTVIATHKHEIEGN